MATTFTTSALQLANLVLTFKDSFWEQYPISEWVRFNGNDLTDVFSLAHKVQQEEEMKAWNI